ncbi:RHS repeat-associated core domain-containing protein [Bergeyella sp. RCAD1439]|uniref:RHS repeat-associated core domain-containing protein n=1 Tax=Bergeyella anatis TaxID=3113737 RepID=UPI002E184C25|nr:SpvB/TcaC N-terminal domain-containing protein [Bergeyella sp. RCAD1439]
MKRISTLFLLLLFSFHFAQNNFHDTQGHIEVNGNGQLQFTLPIALPPAVKSVAPQVNLIYTSGSGNGIAGYGWNLSAVTSISRMGRTIEKDGEVKGIQLDYSDYYSFNGQRLILKSGEYGKNGAEYITEKFSNVKVKSVGTLSDTEWQGPEYWEVTFEDGSQAWYGATQSGMSPARTPNDYNIVKWKDAQGNAITYEYLQTDHVARINTIRWGGNERLGKPHFNTINFTYGNREIRETSYLRGQEYIQNYVLNAVQVMSNGAPFKKYVLHNQSVEGYPRVEKITEYNAQNEAANPIAFTYQTDPTYSDKNTITQGVKDTHTKKYGDFDFDGITDFLEIETNGNLHFKKSVYKEGESESLSYNKGEFSASDFRQSAVITFKKDNIVSPSAGIVIPVRKYKNESFDAYDYEFRIYAVNLTNKTLDFQYSKTLKYEDFKTDSEPVSDDLGCSIAPSSLVSLSAYDYDGDGISEILTEFSYSRECLRRIDPIEPMPYDVAKNAPEDAAEEHLDYYGGKVPVLLPDNTEYYDDRNEVSGTTVNLRIRPPNELQPIPEFIRSTIFFDLKQEVPYEQSFYKFNVEYSESYIHRKPFEMADFNGDGIDELYIMENKAIRNVFTIKKDRHGKYYPSVVMENQPLKGLETHAIMADFNGDGRMDLAIPQAQKSFHWKFYFATDVGFKEYDYTNFIYFSSAQELSNTGSHRNFMFEKYCHYGTTTYYRYDAVDLDKDGKAEITVSKVEVVDHGWNAHNDRENTKVYFSVYSVSKPGHIPVVGHTASPLKYGLTLSKGFYFGGKVIYFSPLFINKTNQQIILVGRPNDCPTSGCDRINVIHLDYKDLPAKTRLAAIDQGKVRTLVSYAELLPSGNTYQPLPAMAYPYLALHKVNQSYVVSRLSQEGRFQDFRYRGLTTHLQGKGMLGFRQMARSSWYAYGFVDTKVWAGTETDPLKEGVPIKEWSIKTNEEDQIFPSDISLNNHQLLSVKLTDYKTDYWVNGLKKTALLPEEKSVAVTAMVPTSTTSKDFMTDMTTVESVEYNSFYLPVKTTSNLNNNFAVSTTQMDYYPPNLEGLGSQYSVGRPRQKIELRQAYGDSKGAKEEYTYENNQLKTLTSWNNDNTGWVRETYAYDDFGNIIKKEITNSLDEQKKSSLAQYEDKGRFVVKKNEIAGDLNLETHISYNDWGQVLTQQDPLGGILTNTYDAWGKIQTSNTNLSGTTTYQYQKLSNGDAVITQISPDGSQSSVTRDKWGREYLSTTKGFDSGTFVSKMVQYDILGRKTAESEPYITGQMPTQWNRIQYDDYSRPIKATAFTGKVVETTYEGRTTTVRETNADHRFRKQTTDALGNVITSEDKGGVIHFKYNAASQNTEARYDTNVVTTKYDNWGRKAEFHDPSNGTYRYEYRDGFGKITKAISPKGYKEYQYNAAGQLVTQREQSNEGGSTQKTITYAYNAQGLLLSKSGTANGEMMSSQSAYDQYGRLLSTTEQSFGKTYGTYDIVYDDKNRITSYRKRMVSNGTVTQVHIENLYHPWNGTLYRLKDKDTDKTLWQLNATNAKGQITNARLGAVTVDNIYDQNGFLSSINHSTPQRTILQVGYRFNAIKNELNSRVTGGDFNIIEQFAYDDFNRLVNWTDPVTGAFSQGQNRNVYDRKGRIVENDALGVVKFEDADKIYQMTRAELSPQGERNLSHNLVQVIQYNENNDPTAIEGTKGDYLFSYGLSSMRQRMEYGGKFIAQRKKEVPITPPTDLDPGEPILVNPYFPSPPTDLTGDVVSSRFTKYYSEDGAFEVIRNNGTGQEKHLIYIDGTPYESHIIFVKDYNESSGSYKFLHKDYLGSILAISDEAGNKIEQRHYDAWGNLTHLQFGNGEIITNKERIADSPMLIDRGYTSHEHLLDVGLIHMNGRLYDPLLRRFLNADENIQDAFNTQNYNKYGYVLNNPLMYNDPSGEFIGIVFGAIKIISTIITAIQVVKSVDALVTGRIDALQFTKGIFFMVVSKVVSAGVGDLFKAGGDVAKALGDYTFLAQAGVHAASQSLLSTMQGGNFGNTFWKGFGTNLTLHGLGMLTSSKKETEGGNAPHSESKDAEIAPTSEEGLREILIPEVVLPKQEGYWGSKIYSHVNNAIADFNVYQSRMRLANAIQHSNAAQSVGRFEQFLFDEAPGWFLGGLPIGRVGRIAAKTSTSVIKGVTQHATNQAVTRGFKTANILKIVREGTPIQAAGRYGTQTRYTLGGNTVVVNAQGKVVTVFSNAQGTAKGLGKGHFIPFE